MDIQKEREAPNTEFNETINLVEAVLERLEFHAFEEVLIWSEEHASKALLRCLKKTLSEFKNGHLVLTSSYPKLKHFSVDNVVKGLMTALSHAQEHQSNLNREIDELKDQLAKAQAVPEWISVKDNLPPANILVLGMSVTRSNIFNIYNVMALDEFEEADVTHWMPLPDAPQEPTND
ncbi:DUF551 domain-containing protein [Acinetobacter ursingii]|uniref:DUF551 domain-containing protein n=1 Tax=Acinetobacter ursingii TaxID=108980 RepID=UPI00300AB6E1